MKLTKRVRILIFAAGIGFTLLSGLRVPFLYGSRPAGGCDPNSTCPPGTIPIAIECTSGNCENYNTDGYCIYCH